MSDNYDTGCRCDNCDGDPAYVLTQQGLVAAFYYAKLGRLPTPAEARERLLEELAELSHALSMYGPAGQLKELADVLYTAYGYALARGWNLREAFRLVHISNMTKEPATTGKIQKGDAYVAPDLGDCMGDECGLLAPGVTASRR